MTLHRSSRSPVRKLPTVALIIVLWAMVTLIALWLAASIANGGVVRPEWTPSGNYESPRLQILALDQHTGTLFGATDYEILRSLDRGATWVVAGADLGVGPITSMVLDEVDGTLYVGTVDGLFRSTDLAATWTGSALTGTAELAVLPVGDRQALVAIRDNGEVLATTDGGKRWSAVVAGRPVGVPVSCATVDLSDHTLLLGTGTGLLRVAASGNAWPVSAAGMSDQAIQAVSVDEMGRLYAVTGSGELYRSVDTGRTWVAAADMPYGTGRTLALDPTSEALLAGGYGEVYRSVDAGSTWQPVSMGVGRAQVLALVWDRGRYTLYAATEAGLVFSVDGGLSWLPPSTSLTGVPILSLTQHTDGLLYAGSLGRGVYRSGNGGQRWQDAGGGLTAHSLRALLSDARRGLVLAATEGGVLQTADGGRTWQRMGSGLAGVPVLSLALEERTGNLYAGTWGHGVFLLSATSSEWEPTGAQLATAVVSSMLIDELDGSLYAATEGGGLFRSQDGGESWEQRSSGPGRGIILALALDRRNRTMHAGTDAGPYRSPDGGENWTAGDTGTEALPVRSLIVDEQRGLLLAGAGESVLGSADGGRSWQARSTGLPAGRVWSLAVAQQPDGSAWVFAGTSDGVYRSEDGGARWRYASGEVIARLDWTGAMVLEPQGGLIYAALAGAEFSLPATGQAVKRLHKTVATSAAGEEMWQELGSPPEGILVQGLAAGPGGGRLYGAADGKVAVYDAGLGGWTQLSTGAPACSAADLFGTGESYGVMVTGPGWNPVWATVGGGACWAQIAARLELSQAAIRPLPGGGAELFTLTEEGLAQAELAPGYRRVSLAWLVLRAAVSRAESSSRPKSPQDLLLPIWIFLLVTPLVLFSVPAVFGLARRMSLPSNVRWKENAVDLVWTRWQEQIHGRLISRGELTPQNLAGVPRLFRRYALARYELTHREEIALETTPNGVRLSFPDRLRRWRDAFGQLDRELEGRAEITQSMWGILDTLTGVLSEALGLACGQARGTNSGRGYPVEAPAWRIAVPRSFPLVYTAAMTPSGDTAEALIDTVDVMQNARMLALVVPLNPVVPEFADLLHVQLDTKGRKYDLVILQRDEIERILLARKPAEMLTSRFLRQIDLSIISPFHTKGAVTGSMFFGREAQIKALLETTGGRSYALVGNRVVGKTSLMIRTRERMAAIGEMRPIWLDLEEVSDIAGFCDEFSERTGMRLEEESPRGFRRAVTELRRGGPPLVFLVDEVDALLAAESGDGDRLAATWRRLSQEGVCQFVVCGNRVLARKLRDATSPLYNHVDEMRLGPLLRPEARLLIGQPMDKLGVEMEDRDALLDELFDLTSGHAHLLQYVGEGLIMRINERRQRLVLRDDVEAIAQSIEFRDHYRDVIWEPLTPLERLILLAMPPEGCTQGQIAGTLEAMGVATGEKELRDALELLEVFSILRAGPDQDYAFVPQQFPHILRLRGLEGLVRSELGEWAKERAANHG